MKEISSNPLVSIGIPTFNRPEGLRKTLECITKQTYQNLEIIISNNFSDQIEVEQVIEEFTSIDSRIKPYKQNINIGLVDNFKFVLNKSTGKYFMWASDDDVWIENFVEKTTAFLEKNDNYVAVSMEAQYFDNNLFDYFAEGKLFYDFFSVNKLERLKFILKHNYGNLIYGLFRKSILDNNNIMFSYNEIPFFLQVFEKGNWKVLPEIGLYKKTSFVTYKQAKWEIEGGRLMRKNNMTSIKNIIHLFKYHKIAYYDILTSINYLPITKLDKKHLRKVLLSSLGMHFLNLLLGAKKEIQKESL